MRAFVRNTSTVDAIILNGRYLCLSPAAKEIIDADGIIAVVCTAQHYFAKPYDLAVYVMRLVVGTLLQNG